MKFTSILISILGSSLLFPAMGLAENALTNGHYTGRGQWHDSSGQTGEYDVQTVIDEQGVSSTYEWGGGETRRFAMKLEPTGSKSFSVKLAEQSVGWMYCMDVQCHLDLIFDANQNLEETLTFVDGKLYKLGSKSLPNGSRVFWQEDLNRQ